MIDPEKLTVLPDALLHKMVSGELRVRRFAGVLNG